MGGCCCLQTYNLNVNLEGMRLVLGQRWMVVLINRCILFCPPIIMCEACCCLHIYSVVNMLVMGLVLGQSLKFISTTSILLYPKVCPFYNGNALMFFTCKLHNTYLLGCLRYGEKTCKRCMLLFTNM